MKNFWLSLIDRALLYLGYNTDVINYFAEDEKQRLITDEYLYRLSQDNEDCAMTVEDMAEYLIEYQKRN
jgi:hypothetical protein